MAGEFFSKYKDIRDIISIVLFYANIESSQDYYDTSYSLNTSTEKYEGGIIELINDLLCSDFLKSTIKDHNKCFKPEYNFTPEILNLFIKNIDTLLSSKAFTNALKDNNYFNINDLEEDHKKMAKERNKMAKEDSFTLLSQVNTYTASIFYDNKTSEELSNDSHLLGQIVNEKSQLYQKVRPDSILTEKGLAEYKRLCDSKKKSEESKKKRLEKKKEEKKKKEIENAKKLLEKEGIKLK